MQLLCERRALQHRSDTHHDALRIGARLLLIKVTLCTVQAARVSIVALRLRGFFRAFDGRYNDVVLNLERPALHSRLQLMSLGDRSRFVL